MCSVTGVLLLDPRKYSEVEARLAEILIRAEDRGRDSFGIVTISSKGEISQVKVVGRPSLNKEKLMGVLSPDTKVVVANNRAEPTTEFVKFKTERDVQPFVGNRFVVSHNGIIANDLELEKRLELKRDTRIDSAVLPPLLDKRWDGSLEGLRDLLNLMKGSFALVIGDRERPDRIFLAQNFKPLYMAYDVSLKAVFFTSLDDYFGVGPFDPVNMRKLDPYTVVEVTDAPSLRTLQLQEYRKKRALVVASGGLDSTVAATKVLREGYEVTLLHFNYHHKAEEKEREAVRRIAEFLHVDLMEVNTDLFSMVGNATLLKGGGEIVKERRGEEGAEFAHEWVPARNSIFFTVALAIAESKGYDAVVSGVNLEEAGAYPDNEMEFVRMFQKLAPYAVGPNKRVEILMPVGNLVKHEIVKLGLEIGAPLHLTWSCYEGGSKHCGRCGPCYMRKTAFRINGVEDPVEYEDRD
ncbi:queuosine biosynthesis protein QueC [Metallosphaera yellowstonensis MK1]|uniref:7-cyano-7-deazaguanine synthase n=1 Tax=Metallosphaera yellowstonensis MK1 TaxID=671065 RepID=H2C3Q7_9CREN|nr:7-cyano-7-deazaguanine synthase QueC [Metallosphaera yellowstonensis]EHP70878.1 queuosine biosynthesis protein QueC [Metallosphaera yellowstonensis MK1]